MSAFLRGSVVFFRSPAFDTPTEAASWLLEQGIAPRDFELHRGPDRSWRGSGIRHRGHPAGVVTPRPVAVRLGGVAQDGR